MLKSFFHSGFIVRDVDQAVEFYTNVLGLQVAMRMERQGQFIDQVLGFSGAHIKGAFLDLGDGHQLELIQYLSPASRPGGLNRNDLGQPTSPFTWKTSTGSTPRNPGRVCAPSIRRRNIGTSREN